ncbi:MAG: glycosyltransferase [Candidatus Micrarchaeaceae archaeon]
MKNILVMESGSFKTFGGAANATYDIYKFLKESNEYKVDLFADFTKLDSNIKSITTHDMIKKKYDVIFMNSIRDVPFVLKYLLNKKSKDAKYIYVDRGNVLLNFKKARVKKLLPKMIIRQYLMRKMKNFLSCYIALSALQLKLATNFFKEKTQLCYLPITPNENFKRVLVGNKSEHAIYVGRLDEKQKKVGGLIKGVERVATMNPELKSRHLLTIVGTGPDEEKYKKYVKEMFLEKNIKFEGYANEKDVVRYYNSSGFFVSNSEWEGMSRTFVEAMACGLPLLINEKNNTLIGYNPITWLVTNEYNGLVYKYADIEDFARRFYDLYKRDSLRRELSRNAYEFSKQFNNLENLKTYKDIIDRLLSNKLVSSIIFKQ